MNKTLKRQQENIMLQILIYSVASNNNAEYDEVMKNHGFSKANCLAIKNRMIGSITECNGEPARIPQFTQEEKLFLYDCVSVLEAIWMPKRNKTGTPKYKTPMLYRTMAQLRDRIKNL